ncbi:hypothetical protein ABZ611_23355 [Streptomyces sp. NPDC007861]|uniref:hypothetical protein n=1 Tax=Streptomyces sp. NPDC007861 TaxID=3154893 RepID=UPI0033C121D6
MDVFRQRVDEHSGGPAVPSTLRERIRELQGELREAHRARHEEITDLRQAIDTLAQLVQALTHDIEWLRAELARQGITITTLPATFAPSRE